MAREIERKYLVIDEGWRSSVQRERHIEQGYLAITDACAVRVRIAGRQANINIKNATLDIERQEYEYPVPMSDARELLDSMCAGRTLTKTRYWVAHQDHVWEVDVFEGANLGLVVAEIELRERHEHFAIPRWLGTEVSGDARYLNASLALAPYCSWGCR